MPCHAMPCHPPTTDSPPPAPQASTSLSLKATAGLRLLPGTKAQDILEAVKAFFADYPFKVKSDAVAILDGGRSAALSVCAWLTC